MFNIRTFVTNITAVKYNNKKHKHNGKPNCVITANMALMLVIAANMALVLVMF